MKRCRLSLKQLRMEKNKEIGKYVQEAIDAGCDPTAILNDGMIGAMAVVGENFKKEIIFVPQMLAAARAMKAGVEVLEAISCYR